MRTFGKDTPEFFIFTIDGEEAVYKLPLISSLPFDKAIKFAEIAAIQDDAVSNLEAMRLQHALIREYMGERADELSTSKLVEIFEAWMGATAEAGATAGESSALSEQ